MAMGTKLVVNIGSQSKKYALYRESEQILTAHFEHGSDGPIVSITAKDNEPECGSVTPEVYENAVAKLLDMALDAGILTGPSDIVSVGVRIVAPGTLFSHHQKITDEFLRKLAGMVPYAPLHITPAIQEIEQLRMVLPDTQMLAISDSEFHNHMPESARNYGIREDDTELFDIHRFGYHGLSVGSVVRRVPHISGGWMPDRMIIVHLGGGASVTAIERGVGIDTTMGFSPMSGLLMSTRSGDVDVGAALYLAEQKQLGYGELHSYLNTESGFQGLTGHSDMRELLRLRYEGDERAHDAIELFMYRIRKYIGAYIAVLGGLDALILTGTMNERNQHIRKQLCENLGHVGIELDYQKNKMLGEREGYINVDGSMGIAVVHTDEMGEMSRIMDMFPLTYRAPFVEEKPVSSLLQKVQGTPSNVPETPPTHLNLSLDHPTVSKPVQPITHVAVEEVTETPAQAAQEPTPEPEQKETLACPPLSDELKSTGVRKAIDLTPKHNRPQPLELRELLKQAPQHPPALPPKHSLDQIKVIDGDVVSIPIHDHTKQAPKARHIPVEQVPVQNIPIRRVQNAHENIAPIVTQVAESPEPAHHVMHSIDHGPGHVVVYGEDDPAGEPVPIRNVEREQMEINLIPDKDTSFDDALAQAVEDSHEHKKLHSESNTETNQVPIRKAAPRQQTRAPKSVPQQQAPQQVKQPASEQDPATRTFKFNHPKKALIQTELDDGTNPVNITINKPTNVNVTAVKNEAGATMKAGPKRISIAVESDD